MWSAEIQPLSIRLRLLLFLGLGLGALVIVLLVVLDRSVDRQIYGYLDDNLDSRTHAIAVLLESRPITEALAQLHAMSPEFAGGGHTDFLQLWDADGRTLLASDSNNEASLERPRDVPANRPSLYDLRLPDGHKGRAIAVRVSLQGRIGDAILVVADEREQVYALESRVHIAVIIGVLVTSFLAALLAVVVVRGGLRPLRAFSEAARRDAETSTLRPEMLPRELRPVAHALNDAFGRLRHALERERRFTHDVAHELRTPLTEIHTALELARRNPAMLLALDGALASTERMGRCIDGLLALSRFESGMQEVQLEPVDLARLLRRTLALANGIGEPRQIHFRLQAPDECWTQSDSGLLERIFDNLLFNAAEYAPAGSAVDLYLENDSEGVGFRIANDAPSLESADLAKLGERFWRKSAAREASRHGGLGLALAISLAELLGLHLEFRLDGDGKLWAELRGLPTL